MLESVFDPDTVEIHITMKCVVERNHTMNGMFDQMQTNNVYVIHFCLCDTFIIRVTNYNVT